MINVDIGTEKIRENIFTTSLSKRCCVLETFLISVIGFKRKNIQRWILSLSEAELKNKVIRLEGVVLEDFKAQYLKDPIYARVDSLYMITSDGLRSLFAHYVSSNKQSLTKADKTDIDKLSQRYISICSTIRSERINHLVFWEEEVQDEISIPDMANININNSPGAIVNTGKRNHALSHDNYNQTSSRKSSALKPKWYKVICWTFFAISIILLTILGIVKYQEVGNIIETIKSISWRGITLSVCALLTLIGSLYN